MLHRGAACEGLLSSRVHVYVEGNQEVELVSIRIGAMGDLSGVHYFLY